MAGSLHTSRLVADITVELLQNGTSDLSKTKWNKLLFFIDAAYYNSPEGKQENNLTGCEYTKMPFGPVMREFEELIADFRSDNRLDVKNYLGYSAGTTTFITLRDTRSRGQLPNDTANEIVIAVARLFGNYSAVALSNLSHMLDAWADSEMFMPIDFKLTRRDAHIRSKTSKDNLYELIAGQSAEAKA